MILDHLSVLRTMLELRLAEKLDPDSLGKMQAKKLSALLRHARAAPFYRSLPDSFGEIPITKRSDIQASPGQFVPPNSRASRRFLTSGSSGAPISVPVDGSTFNHRMALRFYAEFCCGLSPRDLYAEVSVRSLAEPYLLSRAGLMRRASVPLSDGPKESFAALLQLRPDVIGHFPSLMEMMASLNIESARPLRLKRVFCTGENLRSQSRKHIGDAFSCPVSEQYGSCESGYAAWECPEGRMHASPFHIAEIVDERGKEASSGRLVLTPLHPGLMRLVRYDSGDVAAWGRPCACGRGTPVLGRIEGRNDDPVVLPSGAVLPAVSLSVLYLGRAVGGILQYQIVQESPERFLFRYVPSGRGLSRADERELCRRVESACNGEKIHVEFEAASSIRGSGGKLKRVISRVKA